MNDKPRTLRDALMGPKVPALPTTALDRLQALEEQIKPAWMRAMEKLPIASLLGTTKLPNPMAEFERLLDEPISVSTPPKATGAKRGRNPDRRNAIKARMREDVANGKSLFDKHEALKARYGAPGKDDRKTVMEARDELLGEMEIAIPPKHRRIPRTK